jgi:hypothetical protein
MSSTSVASLSLKALDVIRAPNFICSAVLASSVGQAFDTPTGCAFVNFSPAQGVDYYVLFGSTAAAVPSVSLTTGNGSELNPTLRNVGSTLATTGLSIISPQTGVVTMSWYSGS